MQRREIETGDNDKHLKIADVCFDMTYSELRGLDHKCLVCGKGLPTVTRKEERKGGHYEGYYEVDVNYFNPSANDYAIRLENPKVLEQLYNISINKKRAHEESKLKRNINMNVLTEEFRKIVRESKVGELDKNYKLQFSGFKEFLREFDEPFDDNTTFNGEPLYGVHNGSPCMNTVVSAAEHVNREIGEVDKSEEKMLRAKIHMNPSAFENVFWFISRNYKIADLPSSEENLVLEVRHFSELDK